MTTRILAVSLAWCLGMAAVAGAQDRAARVFGPDRVWAAHLHVKAEDWAAMLPTKSLFGPAGKPAKDRESRPPGPLRGGFGFDFAYVKGDFEFDGTTWADVGVRFKGNSSYAMAGQTVKKPFKVDL